MTHSPDKTSLPLYILFGLSLVLSVIPTGITSILCLILFTLTLILGYNQRRTSDPDSPSHAHAAHIIKTIWRGSSIGFISVIIGGAYMYFTVNNRPLMPCMGQFIDMAPTFNPQDTTNAQLITIFKPCLTPYIQTNKTTLIITAIVMLGPMYGYFIWNYGRGLISVLKSKPL